MGRVDPIPARVVIDLPPIPLTEVLLALIAVLLWRACSLLSDIASSNKQLASKQLSEAPPLTPLPSEGRSLASTPSPERERPIMLSAEAFEKCLLGGDDVQVPLFMAACKGYCNVLNIIGPFTLLTVREVNANMAKIDTSLQLDAAKYCSMRALLTAEVDAGMHQEGAILGDPSAAMGLLWARRGLSFWLEIYRLLLPRQDEVEDTSQGKKSGGGVSRSASPSVTLLGQSFKEVILDAYARTCQPFNGFLTRRSFDFTLGVVPAWQEVAQKLAPTEALLHADMARWISALDRLLPVMESLHKSLDLEDQRKSL